MPIQWRAPGDVLNLLGQQTAIWRWDIETGEMQWSDHLFELVGLAPDDFGGTFEAAHALLHPDDRPIVTAAIDHHIQKDAPFQVRCRLRHSDGQDRTVIMQGTALRDTTGRAYKMLGTTVDISNAALAEKKLADSAESFRSLAENVPGAIFRYIIHTDGTDEIEYMGPGCMDIWELDADQIKGDPTALWATILPEDLQATQDTVMASAETLGPWHHRWRIRTHTGKLKYLEGRGRPERLGEGAIRWNSLILDVTEEEMISRELKRQGELLLQAQKMETIGNLTGGVAHDFNNLLAVILGNLELIIETHDPAEIKKFAHSALTAGKQGAELTQKMLSFARQAPLDPDVIQLNAVVRDMGTWLARVIPESVEVEVSLLAGLWKVWADPSMVQNAILNLILNACDSMSGDGKLTVETGNLRIDEEYIDQRNEDVDPGRYVMLAISDTGEGIPPENLARIFDPFFTTKPAGSGSGLGLSMVQGFMKQSGGTIRVYSEPGVGTTFKLYFPARSGDDATAAHTVDREGQFTSTEARILLVEDEPAVLDMLTTTLHRASYNVTTARSGDDALRIWKEAGGFDLLVTDIVMPGKLQGTHLAKALRGLQHSLPVVFMSGYAKEATVHGNGLRPEDIRLMKPFGRHELVAAVEKALEPVSQDMGVANKNL